MYLKTIINSLDRQYFFILFIISSFCSLFNTITSSIINSDNNILEDDFQFTIKWPGNGLSLENVNIKYYDST
jgi:hypothetical protein